MCSRNVTLTTWKRGHRARREAEKPGRRPILQTKRNVKVALNFDGDNELGGK